jgi:CheY-like chemotaxis protein/pSer/pThr/pTyr-binding forkhead associated (FHA) protein
MPVLRIKLPDNKGEITHVLAGERITVGRRPENTIQIIDRTVSAHHAEFISAGDHYRLHDLGSTNLTCVEGQPITDFHLHDGCKISFGTVECEFAPENPVSATEKGEVVPTRAELEFFRRENLDLQAKIVAMQKQIDILSSARLMTKDTQQLGVMPDVHRRVQQERDELRSENSNLKLDLENLRSDLTHLTKERDALRLAWVTAKNERDQAFARLTDEPGGGTTIAVPSVPHAPSASNGADVFEETTVVPRTAVATAQAQAVSTPPGVASGPASASDTTNILMSPASGAPDHRMMATVLTKVPSALKGLRVAIEGLPGAANRADACEKIATQTNLVKEALDPANGHVAQRLAHVASAMVRGTRFESNIIRTLGQAADVIGSLLDPRMFKKGSESHPSRALLIDDDKDMLETVGAALQAAEVRTTPCPDPTQALELLKKDSFDIILLDVAMPGLSGIDLCAKIRELPQHRKTPIVFITANDSVENRAESTLNGGDDFIAKPFNTLELVTKAATWVARSQFGLKA